MGQGSQRPCGRSDRARARLQRRLRGDGALRPHLVSAGPLRRRRCRANIRAGYRAGRGDSPLRLRAGLGRHRDTAGRRPGRGCCASPEAAALPLCRGGRGWKDNPAAGAMRSPLAYTPSNGALQSASAGAALVYLSGFVLAAFLFSSPLILAAAGCGATLAGLIAGARRAVVASLRFGLVLALTIVIVNGLVTDRGNTVLARLGHWPVLGQVDVTAEALAAGAVIGLRVLVAMVALGVCSACVDPDKVLRLLRPVAARSALTATLISRMVPLAAADA